MLRLQLWTPSIPSLVRAHRRVSLSKPNLLDLDCTPVMIFTALKSLCSRPGPITSSISMGMVCLPLRPGPLCPPDLKEPPQHHLPPSTWDPQGLNLHLINHSFIPSWHIYKFKFENHWYDFRRTSSSLWVLLSSSAKWEVDRRSPKLPSIWDVLCLFQGALCFKSFEQKASPYQQYTQDWAVFTPSAKLERLTLNLISV